MVTPTPIPIDPLSAAGAMETLTTIGLAGVITLGAVLFVGLLVYKRFRS